MDEQNEKKYILPFWVYRVVLVILTCIALYLAIGNIISCSPNSSCVSYPFGKKENYSAEHYDYAEKTIQIVDSYLDSEITAKSALLLLEGLMATCENKLPDDTSSLDSCIENDVSMLYGWIMLDDMNSSSEKYDNILSLRNSLAKRIDKDERQIQMQ